MGSKDLYNLHQSGVPDKFRHPAQSTILHQVQYKGPRRGPNTCHLLGLSKGLRWVLHKARHQDQNTIPHRALNKDHPLDLNSMLRQDQYTRDIRQNQIDRMNRQKQD